jgi:hypothetical protein
MTVGQLVSAGVAVGQFLSVELVPEVVPVLFP